MGLRSPLDVPGCRQQMRCFGVGQLVTQAVEDFGAESITEGTLMEWRKKVGDAVAKGEVVAVVETDKVTIEVNAKEAGTIQELLIKVDETVSRGQPLVRIAAGAGAAPAGAPAPAPEPQAAAGGAPAAPAPSRTVDVAVKDFGAESITEGTLMEWRKEVGEFVGKGDLLAVIETDKVTIEVKAEEAGTLKEVLVKADQTVEAGKTIAKIETGGPPSAAVVPQAAGAAAAPAAPLAAQPAAAPSGAPLTGLRAAFARNAALRAGLPWPLPAAATPAVMAGGPTKPAVAARPPAISVGKGRTERRVPMSPMRQRVVQRMKDAQNTAALLTTFQEADLSAVIGVRSKYQEPFEKKHGVPFGLLSLFAKASACALQEVPGVNAVIDDDTKESVYRDNVDISVPIPSPRGPVSCVLKAVDAMSIRDIEYTIHGLIDKAGKDELAVEDMLGATFGITDTGTAGGMLGTSLINPPQSAVLGTNAVTNRAVVVDGKVVARPVMYLSLTYDHRLIDGREAVTFLCSVRDKMEDPSRLLLDL